jgi:dipeptidyl aminopeptidase/acylaminoacyl peptidase
VTKEAAYQSVGAPVVSEDAAGAREPFYLYTRQQGLWPREVVGHDPDREPKLFDPLCPVQNVTKAYPPTLLLHGDKDTDVPFEQSVLMDNALQGQGVQHEFIAMPGKGHSFDTDMSDPIVAASFDRVLSFLDKQLRR